MDHAENHTRSRGPSNKTTGLTQAKEELKKQAHSHTQTSDLNHLIEGAKKRSWQQWRMRRHSCGLILSWQQWRSCSDIPVAKKRRSEEEAGVPQRLRLGMQMRRRGKAEKNNRGCICKLTNLPAVSRVFTSIRIQSVSKNRYRIQSISTRIRRVSYPYRDLIPDTEGERRFCASLIRTQQLVIYETSASELDIMRDISRGMEEVNGIRE